MFPGPSETESNIIVHVPERGVAFMVDAVGVRVVPWRNMSGSNPHEWLAVLEKMEELDFEILAPGHGPTGNKENVGEYIGYMTALIAAVQDGIDNGQTLEADAGIAGARGVHGLDALRGALRHEHRRRAPRAHEVGTTNSTIARAPAAQ